MKNPISGLLTALCLSSCATVQPVDSSSPREKSDYRINWPEAYAPERAGFFVHNEIQISASPAQVWRELIDYQAWPTYYRGASEVRLQDPAQSVLMPDSVLLWKTMGMQFTSTIKEYEPNRRLSWESLNSKIQGYHAWLIVPQGDGCKLITDESQHGWLTFFQKVFIPNKLSTLHQEWLVGIKQRAEARQ